MLFVKKVSILFFIIVVFFAGCSSKRYYNNFKIDKNYKKNSFLIKDQQKYDINILREKAKCDISKTFNEIGQVQKTIIKKDKISREEIYTILSKSKGL